MAALQLPGWRVLVTAVHPREREDVSERLVAAGVEVLSAFSNRDPPHLVITRSVRSPKYRALMRVHPHTPVVTPDWLAASVQVRIASWASRFVQCLAAERPVPHSVVKHGTQVEGRGTSYSKRPFPAACPWPGPHAPASMFNPPGLFPAPQAGTQQPYDNFRAGPFMGLAVCLSGFNAAQKAALATIVTRGGGVHSPALDRRCTHLVTSSTESEKYR